MLVVYQTCCAFKIRMHTYPIIYSCIIYALNMWYQFNFDFKSSVVDIVGLYVLANVSMDFVWWVVINSSNVQRHQSVLRSGGHGSNWKNVRFLQTKCKKCSQFSKMFRFLRLKFLSTFFYYFLVIDSKNILLCPTRNKMTCTVYILGTFCTM